MFHAEKLFTSLSIKVAPLNFYSYHSSGSANNLFFNNYVGVWLSKMHCRPSYLTTPHSPRGVVKYGMAILGCGLVNYRII